MGKRTIFGALAAFLLLCSCNKEKTAYVFTYFDNSRQDAGLFLAYSTDGYNWTAVNGGEPIMKPLVGNDRIMRDPSICQGPDGTFHLVWTVSWNAKSIGYASSKDLIHWSEQKIVPVMEWAPTTRNTWAPELFYEKAEDLFYIFWASTVPGNPEVSTEGSISEDNYNHRIYCTTTRDFETFSPTRLYFNPSFNVIDACVARIPKTGELIMALKNENLNPPEKNIRVTRSRSMADGFPTEVSAPISGEEWGEGPSILPVGEDLLVYYDKFRLHKYGASISHDGGYTWEDATDMISVPDGISHGTAIAVDAKYLKELKKDRLVPLNPSEAPDYLCTWNLQCYRSNQDGPVKNRAEMREENLFGDGEYQSWALMYPAIREDLFFVLDDSWDIPADRNEGGDNPYFGTVRLDTTRFPSFTGEPAQRLRNLSNRLTGMGWKGLGGWICAQKDYADRNVPEDDFWRSRLEEARSGRVRYWKVDWGRNSGDTSWRKRLTELGRQYAPGLVIEHATRPACIHFSDTYRTYDVENITAQTVTIDRVAALLPYSPEAPAKGIINCEDEPYIAAGLGCAIGIMRHPFAGDLPDGRPDVGFPSTGRDLKHRLDEVVRGVRWHRIALPFGSDGKSFNVDTEILEDGWIYKEGESWIHHEEGDTVKVSAPARVSRGMSLPVVKSSDPQRPFVLASRYPEGAVAVATVGRSLGRSYVHKKVPVEIDVPSVESPVGIFGLYESLTLHYPEALPRVKVLAQDLAAETAVDITKRVRIEGSSLVIPGTLIDEIGLAAASEGDISDPGMVIRVEGKSGS